MWDRIEKMRKKSFAERKRATFFISVGVTALIAFVWGTAVLPRTLTLQGDESTRADAVTPFATLSEDVGLIWGDIQAGIDELGEGLSHLMGKEEALGSDEGLVEDEGALEMSPRGEVGTDAEQVIEPAESEEGSIVEEGAEQETTEHRTIELESGTILEIEG